MAYIGTGVEYALHCLTWIAGPLERPPSSRDLAEMQGVSPAFLKKIFPKLEKAGIVRSTGGIRGGYQLARASDQISVLDVVDAVEGNKKLFDCQEIRGRCAVFDGNPPEWSTRGVCGIHAVMIRAEKTMREELAKTSLADIVEVVTNKAPTPAFAEQVSDWFSGRQSAREDARLSAMRSGAAPRPGKD
ncbi:RrF2 family transcriptional regulator [Aurantiacibacter rhizosphaerae]|uniref:Rrf2 family transcriptional regulator n=1 Tax=Aurantiacibacter rhizosphaerae TaxID=2691582 RepID=A0A844XEY9_9SPHN|nr:Rrf2 family transcriptional regulator [Aurantiacibacter rhizosphaerae]MWV28576.1 Rrf2 family transcriptional regulator [Aurantiacibacter rhizosphaerae]